MGRFDIVNGEIAYSIDGEMGFVVVNVENESKSRGKSVSLNVMIKCIHLIAIHIYSNASRTRSQL